MAQLVEHMLGKHEVISSTLITSSRKSAPRCAFSLYNLKAGKIMKDLALFEYDGEQGAVIDTTHEHLGIKLPELCVFAFVGDEVDLFAKQHNAKTVAHFISITKNFPVYVLNIKGKDICLCQAPCGAAPAVMILDWLIGYGVKKIVSTGSCGVLCDLPENYFLIPERALREEGTSFHYLPPERYIDLDADILAALEGYFESHKIAYTKCTTWTTDGFFRETKKKVTERRSEGCSCVDMECSALAACARFRGVSFGQFFFTADSLNSIDDYDARDFGVASMRPALDLAVDIAVTI